MSADDTIVGHDVRVRQAGPADFDQLREVDARIFGTLAYPYFTIRQLFDAFPECWLVAAHPSGLVGYSLGVPSADHSYAWLFGLAVDPDHRRRGYGRRLTAASLNLLAGLRVETALLTVEPGNIAAQRLYRSFGFVETAHRRDYFGPGEDRVVMACDLRGRAVIPNPRLDDHLRS
jgi:ribosomal protein S18 acetylase RimI-like enzyme